MKIIFRNDSDDSLHRNLALKVCNFSFKFVHFLHERYIKNLEYFLKWKLFNRIDINPYPHKCSSHIYDDNIRLSEWFQFCPWHFLKLKMFPNISMQDLLQLHISVCLRQSQHPWREKKVDVKYGNTSCGVFKRGI